MIVEIALCVIAAAVSVIAITLAALSMQIKTALIASETVLANLNRELPSLLTDMRAAVERVNGLVEQARGGVEHAVVLLHTAGRLGDTLQLAQRTVQEKGRTVLARLAGVVSGVRAATNVLKQRMHHEGGAFNGT
ncbi:MAG: DUF948 domain-containing protein [Nitrospira sp. CG24D]|jgi:uncharacterized protein YoxC|nr:MAG: DUF948 domain-containing protein [Nitrospira sp. CG24D]